MTKERKIEIISDILELNPSEISENLTLEDVEAWDSVAVLSVIAVINEEFERYPLAEEIREYKTVWDLMKAFE